jgi:predicted Zn-dependent protease
MSLTQLALRAQAWVLLAAGAARRRARRCSTRMLRAGSRTTRFALASRAHLRVQSRRGPGRAARSAPPDRHPARHPAAWFNLGFLLDVAGRPAEAEPALRAAVALDPKLDRAWYGLGLALLQLRPASTRPWPPSKRNTELQPMSPYGWTQLARAHARAEQPPRRRASASSNTCAASSPRWPRP